MVTDPVEISFEFTDKRKIDPESGQVREGSQPESQAGNPAEASETTSDPLAGLDFEPSLETAELEKAKAQAAEHLDALQRERASFTNYRNRTLRDLDNAKLAGTQAVLEALLPVLDDIERARQNGGLEGPMQAIADKLDETLAKFDVQRFGQVGQGFDPTLHEAFMHRDDAAAYAPLAQQAASQASEEAPFVEGTPVIELVIEPGYRIKDRVVRPARVGVVGQG